jgi:L-arabinose isomerase
VGLDRYGFHEPEPIGARRSRVRIHREPARVEPQVVVGHWRDETVQARIGTWSRAAAAWSDWQRLKIARFGDNMREVAVTEGDKVEAQARLGYSVNRFGVGDLVGNVNRVSDAGVDRHRGVR